MFFNIFMVWCLAWMSSSNCSSFLHINHTKFLQFYSSCTSSQAHFLSVLFLFTPHKYKHNRTGSIISSWCRVLFVLSPFTFYFYGKFFSFHFSLFSGNDACCVIWHVIQFQSSSRRLLYDVSHQLTSISDICVLFFCCFFCLSNNNAESIFILLLIIIWRALSGFFFFGFLVHKIEILESLWC